MYTRELLLAVGLLLLLTFGRREHLAFTETIKDVRNTVSPEEQNRIFALAPASLQQAASAANAAGGYAVDRSKSILAQIVRDFQTDIYVPATAPVTEAVVDNFVSTKRAYYQANPTASNVAFFTAAYSNGDAKRLLVAYLNLTPAGTIPPISNLPTSSSSSVSIPNLLEQMRDNLLEYKMTGRSEYKSVYEGIKAWLDQYITNLNLQLARESDTITSDVTSYRSANSEMTQTQADFQRVKTEGPKLEDSYLTIKKQMDQVPGPDTSGLYVKGGIAVGLVVGAIALTLF
jgi:hypothetical protein